MRVALLKNQATVAVVTTSLFSKTVLIPLFLVGATLCVSGCHRATRQDCEQILDRIVELELNKQGIKDPQTVASRKQEIRKAKEQELLRSCVGHRVSKSAMNCIKHAKSSEEITSRCLQ